METLLEYLAIPIVTLVCAALGLATNYLLKLSRKISNETLREESEALIMRVNNELTDAIKHTAVNYVNDIKAARADGKLTQEEIEEARRRAIEIVRSRLSDAAKNELENITGGLTKYLTEQIDVIVEDLKKK